MIKKLFAPFVLLGALSVTANAGMPLPATFIQNITLQLSVVAPGKTAASLSSATVSNLTINTMNAIEAIGEATTNKFSATAQLLAVAPIVYYTNPVVTVSHGKSITNLYVYGYPGNPAFQIKDGTKVVDVSGFINVTTLNSSTYIASYALNSTGGYTSFKNYRVRSISITNSALAFSGQGFVETPLVNVPVKPGVVVVGWNDDWTSVTGVASNGQVNGILQGVISATFERLQ
jgi:hypothetical protein